MRHILFVGEKRSATAIMKDWTWQDGHLAAKTLFDALKAAGLSLTMRRFTFVNAYEDDGGENHDGKKAAINCSRRGCHVIALGRKAEKALLYWGIPYTFMVHPAARGSIRKASAYHAHVKAVLASLPDAL